MSDHIAAIQALRADPEHAQRARTLLELSVREPVQAQAARFAVEPTATTTARPLSLDLIHERYDRHNLHMPDRPRTVAAPRDLTALANTLQSAADAWQPIRAIGDGYGFANTGFTRGTLIPLASHIDRLLELDRAVLCDGAEPETLLQFEAGATIDQLNSHLWPRGRALYNQPGFERLTFAGTMSSGGHGSGIWTGPLSAQVVSLHLLTIDAQRRVLQVRVEPKAGITQRAKFTAKYPGVELIQDDRVFDACTCAMGCCGVIYSLVIAVRRAYNIRESRTKYPWPIVRERLPVLLAEQGPNKRLHSTEVWINPYPVDGEVHCVLTERSETAEPPHGERGLGVLWGGIDAVYRLISWWMRVDPCAVPALLDAALGATQASNVVLTAPQGLNFGPPNAAPVTAASGSIPAEKVGAVADSLIALFQERQKSLGAYINSPMGLRFVKAASAHLSPAHGRDSCMIEIPILEGTAQARATLRAYHDTIYAQCLGRPHWGQVNDMPADRLENMYPALPAFLESYRVLNPNGFFDNAFTEQLGLRHRAG
jgi:hypothetical protein